MTVDKLSLFIFVLLLSSLACSNDNATEQTDKEEAISSPNPVLVTNETKEDTITKTISDPEPASQTQAISNTEKTSPVKVPSPTAKINQKPTPSIKPEDKSAEQLPEEKPAITEDPAKVPEAAKAETSSPKEEMLETTTEKEVKKEEIHPLQASHEAWDVLLKKYVTSDGKVNYRSFKANKGELQAYLDHLAQNPVQASWSRTEKMAYWINAYNAFTIKLIVDNYPVKSIMDLHGGKAWDVKWIKLGDKTYSLNQIEHDILRSQFGDARIHFAVNCAAKSCPPLLNRAWKASNLESTFDQQAKKFINNSTYNKISANQVQLSKIFEWYASDFGNIISYLNQYASTTIKTNAKVSYLEYNWALNE